VPHTSERTHAHMHHLCRRGVLRHDRTTRGPSADTDYYCVRRVTRAARRERACTLWLRARMTRRGSKLRRSCARRRRASAREQSAVSWAFCSGPPALIRGGGLWPLGSSFGGSSCVMRCAYESIRPAFWKSGSRGEPHTVGSTEPLRSQSVHRTLHRDGRCHDTKAGAPGVRHGAPGSRVWGAGRRPRAAVGRGVVPRCQPGIVPAASRAAGWAADKVRGGGRPD
jgi:hypothetical protein